MPLRVLRWSLFLFKKALSHDVQEEGTFHFRTTILVPEKDTDEVAKRLVKFHNDFLAKYGEPEQ